MAKILVSTIFGHKTKQPIVVMKFNKTAIERREVQLSVAEARDLALSLLSGAEAAIQDACMIDFAKSMDLDDAGQASLMGMYRQMRRDRQSDDTA